MASIFKSLAPSDHTIVPFPTYYNYNYTYTSGSVNNSPDVLVSYGERYVNLDTKLVRYPNPKHELFDSVLQTFYSNVPFVTYGITPKSFIPDNNIQVISVTQDVYGEKILPGSFSIKFDTSQSYDDGKGNIIVSSSGTGSIIGSIFYDKGIAVLRSMGFKNLNPDPLWEDIEGGEYPDGWQHALERKLTSELTGVDGVVHAFPKQETYAAKIATRSSLYISASSFYTRTVSAGEVYRMSGWVYANGTTWRGIQNGNTPGADYQLGYIAVLTPGPEYVGVTTELGPIGWQYVEKEFTIPSGITGLSFGPYIDGPFPAGFSYGEPVCTDNEGLQGCPGYAWFAGFKIEKITSPIYEETTGVMDNRGIFIVNGSSIDVSFSSSITLYEHAYKVKLNPTEFLYAFNNPTVTSEISGSSKTAAEWMVSQSILLPYVTTIGFYNENNELLMVAKPSVPIQRTTGVTQTFIVKFDV